MKSPLISIIIPIHNRERFLDRCLASVCAQTFHNMEIILIDDGSTDKTPSICDKWAKKDSRIRLIHTPNRGVAEARNLGLKIASGNYIGFVDSDDWIEKEMVEELYLSLQKHNADISMCGIFLNSSDNGQTLGVKNDSSKEYVITGNKAFKLLIMDKTILSYLWNKLFRRELFLGISFPPGRVFEDHNTIYKLFARSKHVSHTGKNRYHYIQHPLSILNANTPQMEIDFFWSNVDRIQYIRQCKFLSEKEKKQLSLWPVKSMLRSDYKIRKETPATSYASEKKAMSEAIKKIYWRHYHYIHFFILDLWISIKKTPAKRANLLQIHKK